MKILLEIIEERDRSDHSGECWLCSRRFVEGPVACWAYSDDGELDCGPLCPTCIEEGPGKMAERLEEDARWSRLIAEDAELLADEGVTEAPTIEELRMMESIAAPH